MLMGSMVGVQKGGAARFCTQCGQPLGGLASCPSCGTPAATTRRAARRPMSAKARRGLLWAGVVAAVLVVVVVVILSLIPVAQRASYQETLPVTGPTARGCGETIFVSWTFPVGKTVHLTWTTNPVIDVALNVTEILPSSFGPSAFFGNGSSGTGTFNSNGGPYGVILSDCQTQPTTATISAYYNFNAPILW